MFLPRQKSERSLGKILYVSYLGGLLSANIQRGLAGWARRDTTPNTTQRQSHISYTFQADGRYLSEGGDYGTYQILSGIRQRCLDRERRHEKKFPSLFVRPQTMEEMVQNEDCRILNGTALSDK